MRIKKLRFCSFVMIFLGAQTLLAQQNPQIIQRSIDLYPLLKNQLIPSNPADSAIQMINELPHALFRYVSDSLTTAVLHQNNPDRDSFPEEKYRLVLPDMTGMPDTLVLMVGLEDEQGNSVVNTMVIGNMRDRLAYFVDDNNNYDFTDDGPAIVFNRNEKIKKVVVEAEAGKFEYLMYDLALHEDYLKTRGLYLMKRKKQPAKKFPVPLLGNASRLNLMVNFFTGNGDQSFSYVTTTDSLRKEYGAAIDAVFQLNGSVSYAYRHFNIGASLAIEANQIGRAQEYVYGKEGRTINYNIGKWPRTRFLYGLFAEYDLRLYRNLYLTPTYHIFWYQYLQDDAFGGYGNELNQQLTHQDIFLKKSGKRYGGKLKLPLSERTLFFVEISYVQNSFDLHEDLILEEHEERRVDTEYTTLHYGFGCQVLLMNRSQKEKLSRKHPQNGVY